jgi:preprotein translocase subunit Sec61beta
MSNELEIQKELIGWHKDLFKWLLTVILALAAGLISLIGTSEKPDILFYIGFVVLVLLVINAFFYANKVMLEIEKIRSL